MKKPEPKEYKVLDLFNIMPYFKSKGFKYEKQVMDRYCEEGNGKYFYMDELDDILNDPPEYNIEMYEFAKMFIEEYGSGYNYIITVDW